MTLSRDELTAIREAISARPPPSREGRPPSSARGVHHVALISHDVERTVEFYQDLLEFPLTEMFENRDYQGSTHFFFDIGNGNALAFFDLPGLDLGPYAEVLGGLHHLEGDRPAFVRPARPGAGPRVERGRGAAAPPIPMDPDKEAHTLADAPCPPCGAGAPACKTSPPPWPV